MLHSIVFPSSHGDMDGLSLIHGFKFQWYQAHVCLMLSIHPQKGSTDWAPLASYYSTRHPQMDWDSSRHHRGPVSFPGSPGMQEKVFILSYEHKLAPHAQMSSMDEPIASGLKCKSFTENPRGCGSQSFKLTSLCPSMPLIPD